MKMMVVALGVLILCNITSYFYFSAFFHTAYLCSLFSQFLSAKRNGPDKQSTQKFWQLRRKTGLSKYANRLLKQTSVKSVFKVHPIRHLSLKVAVRGWLFRIMAWICSLTAFINSRFWLWWIIAGWLDGGTCTSRASMGQILILVHWGNSGLLGRLFGSFSLRTVYQLHVGDGPFV